MVVAGGLVVDVEDVVDDVVEVVVEVVVVGTVVAPAATAGVPKRPISNSTTKANHDRVRDLDCGGRRITGSSSD